MGGLGSDDPEVAVPATDATVERCAICFCGVQLPHPERRNGHFPPISEGFAISIKLTLTGSNVGSVPLRYRSDIVIISRLPGTSFSECMREQVIAEIVAIDPFDALEAEHVADALSWIASGAEIFRVSKPALPPKHLVSYFVLVDGESVLLVDHKKAQLWLPTGGHVEPGEHPRATVRREMKEELGLDDTQHIGPPLLITCTETVGLTAGHTDVSLWYAIPADRHQHVRFDPQEFNSVRWFEFSDVPFAGSDPHMGRFIRKLQSARHTNASGAGGCRKS